MQKDDNNLNSDINIAAPSKKSIFIQILYNIAGTISLVLGIVGIILPLLPTTPFLLLATACFYRGSKKMHNWLLNHKIFGKYIKDYIEKNAISARIKSKAISVLWITIGITFVFFTDLLYLRIVLLVIAIGVTTHLVKLDTLED